MSTFAQSLNYLDLKRKSVGARNYRVNISPRNGGIHNASGNVQLQLPTIARSYADLSQAYIKLKLRTAGTAGFLDKNAYSLINRFQTSVAGTIIDEISQANVLLHALYDLGTSKESANGFPFECLGSAGDPVMPNLGKQIASNADTTLCIPLPNIGVCGMERLLPLDVAEGLVITLFLETANDAFLKGDAGTAHPTGYQLSEIELIVPVTELSAESQNLLDQGLGENGYTMNIQSVNHTATSKETTNLNVNTNLGFRYSSLSAIMTVMRASTNVGGQLCMSNRSHGNLKSYQINIGGQKYPQRAIEMEPANHSEVLAELLLMKNVLNDETHQMSLNRSTYFNYDTIDKLADDSNVAAIMAAIHPGLAGVTSAAGTAAKAGAAASLVSQESQFNIEDGKLATAGLAGCTRSKYGTDVGTFMVGVDLDVFKSNADGLYNSLNTIGQQVTSEMVFSGNSTSALTIDHYGFYNAVLIVDPVTRAFEVSY